MGRRVQPRTLKAACIRSVARNMDKHWCADYYQNFYDQGTFMHVIGPLSDIPPALINELLDCLVANSWMKRYYLQMLIDRRMETLDLSVCRKAANKDSIINLVGVRCNRLTSLNVRNCSSVTARVLADLVVKLPQLISLNIGLTKCNDQVLTQIGHNCHKLVELDIYGCPITDMGIMSLCVSFDPKQPKVPRLSKLDIAFTAVTHKAVEVALLNCPNLQVLGYPDICDAVYYMDRNDRFENLLHSETLALRTLNVSMMKDTGLNMDETLRISCLRCPNASEVSVHRGVSDEGVLHLATLNKLRSLHLTNDTGEGITFEGSVLPLIRAVGTNLTDLNLSEVNFIDIGVIGQCCENLRRFILLIAGFQSAFFPVHSHPELTAIPGNTRPFKELEVLHISLYTDENNFSLHFFRLLLINTTKLRELKLVKVQEFNDENFSQILEENSLSKIQNLTLERCNDINVDVIYDYCEADNDLLVLQLLYCESLTRIDKEQLEALAEEDNFNLTLSWC